LPDHSYDHDDTYMMETVKTYTADQMQAYAREALRAQAASVEAVATIRTWIKNGGRHADLQDWEDGIAELAPGEHKLYAGAPPTPAHIPADVSPPQAPQAVVQDTARLDALARPGWELSQNNDPECFPEELWQVHRVSGGRNDREWTLIGQGDSPRAAIDSALATKGQQA